MRYVMGYVLRGAHYSIPNHNHVWTSVCVLRSVERIILLELPPGGTPDVRTWIQSFNRQIKRKKRKDRKRIQCQRTVLLSSWSLPSLFIFFTGHWIPWIVRRVTFSCVTMECPKSCCCRREIAYPRGGVELLGAFFVTIATILGTGILALPVELSLSGFWPFVLVFLVSLLMQLAVVFLTVELMQRAHVTVCKGPAVDQEKRLQSDGVGINGGLLTGNGTTKGFETIALETPPTDTTNTNSDNMFYTLQFDSFNEEDTPDLHRMGKLFLSSKWLQRGFDLSVVCHFAAVLVSYNLAGPQAYADLFQMHDYKPLIVPFNVLYACVVVFGGKFIRPVISFLTFLKVVALVLVLVAVSVVSSLTHVGSSDDWSHTMEPFLMGTFALGGVVNLMPVMYQKLPFLGGTGLTDQQKVYARSENRKLVHRFRGAVASGVFMCFFLNLIWCYIVLKVVPQRANSLNVPPAIKKLGLSLERSRELGEISTVPIVQVIHQSFPEYQWTIFFVDMFVIISITVSFLTLGSGLKNFLDGFAFSFWPKSRTGVDENGTETSAVPDTKSSRKWKLRAWQYVLYLLGFGLILTVAMLNPDGFVVFLSVFGSFALNIECGLFVALMVRAVRQEAVFRDQFIPVKLSEKSLGVLEWFSTISFSIAVLYDWLTAGHAFGIEGPLWYAVAVPALVILLLWMFRAKMAALYRGLGAHTGEGPYTKV